MDGVFIQLRDAVGIFDIVLWECYCYVLGCFGHSRSDGGTHARVQANAGRVSLWLHGCGVPV